MARIKNSELMGAFLASLLVNTGFILLTFYQPKILVLGIGIAYNLFIFVFAYKNLLMVIREEQKNDAFIAEIHRKQGKKVAR